MSSLRESSAWHIQNLIESEPDAQVVELNVAEALEARLSEALDSVESCSKRNETDVDRIAELKAQLSEVERERDEWKAHCSKAAYMFSVADKHGSQDCDGNFIVDHLGISLANAESFSISTPAISLAEIQAKAIEGAALWLSENYSLDVSNPACGLIAYYANNLRQQAGDKS